MTPPLSPPPPKVQKGQPRPIADAHLAILLDTRMYRRTRAMILLAAYAGLRVSEIAAIKDGDIDTVINTITPVSARATSSGRYPGTPPCPTTLIRHRPARRRRRLPGHQRTHGTRIPGHHRHLGRRPLNQRTAAVDLLPSLNRGREVVPNVQAADVREQLRLFS
jgi:integrase